MIYLILLLALILRLPGLSQPLWLDEAAQAIMSKGKLEHIWQVDGDFHPPLFHYLLHFWMDISTTEGFMRILPLIFGIATIYIVYLIGKNYFKSEKIAFFSAFLLAISPYHIWYSQELRSYSLATMLTMLSIYFLARKRWKTYAVLNLIAFFSNYVYLFVIFAEFIYISFHYRNKIKIFLIAQTPFLLFFIFWWPEFQRQLDSGKWLIAVHPEWRYLSSLEFFSALPLTFAKFIFGRVAFEKNTLYFLLIAIVLLAVAVILVDIFRRKEEKGNFILIQLLIPIIIANFVSIWIPLNGPWRLILVLPFLYIAIAYFIVENDDRHLILIFVLISFFGLFMQNYIPKNKKEDWRGAVTFIQHDVANKKKILVAFEFIAPFAPWQWYERTGITAVGVVPAKANEKDLGVFLAPELTGKNTVYLFEYFADVTDPNRLVRKYLEERQFKVVNYYEFNNVGFVYKLRRIGNN